MLSDVAVLETIFGLASTLAMIGWVVLILLPRRWRLVNMLPSVVLPMLLSLAYGAIIMVSFSQSDGGGFSSLAAVKQLFTNDAALLAGWIHYLAFDLFVGSWIARQSDQMGLSRLIQAPILLLTFMLGPLGFLVFKLTAGGWQLVKQRGQAV